MKNLWFAIQLTRQDDRTTGLGHRLARCRTGAATSCLLSSTILRANATCYGWNTILNFWKWKCTENWSSLIMDEWFAVCHPRRSAELSKPSQSRVLCGFWKSVRESLRERQRGESACFCEEKNRKWRLFSGSWEMALH
jgi:hypothetical protein